MIHGESMFFVFRVFPFVDILDKVPAKDGGYLLVEAVNYVDARA